MTQQKQTLPEELEQYPSEIEEGPGRVPLFLKLTYVAFVLFGIAYLTLYFSGDGTELVEQLNRATSNAVP
jgi:hypothetical protein